MMGRAVLQSAQHELAETGRIETNGSWRPFMFTNEVAVDGVVYPCLVATPLVGFEREGVLAMTANQTIIWVDRKQSPKVIPKLGYKARFFPEGF